MIKQRQFDVQAILNRAVAQDMEILEKYRGKEAIMEIKGYQHCQGGIIKNIGSELIELSDCKEYNGTSIREYQSKPMSPDLNRFKQRVNRAILKNRIEEIVLLEDLKKKMRGEE